MHGDREVERITLYLYGGGLFNPELALHDHVRDLLMDCRKTILELQGDLQISQLQRDARK